MRFIVILGGIFFGFFQFSNAQIATDSVHVYKNFWGYKYFQNDERLNFNQLPHIMKGDQGAFYLIKKARSNSTIASIISGAGGFVSGWQLGTAIVGGNPNWGLAALGGGLMLVSIPIYSNSYKQSLKAVDMYNSGLSANIYKPILMLGMTKSGMGVRLKF